MCTYVSWHVSEPLLLSVFIRDMMQWRDFDSGLIGNFYPIQLSIGPDKHIGCQLSAALLHQEMAWLPNHQP